ncbi:AAA family ATPase, partial [Campylobacter jejuni]
MKILQFNEINFGSYENFKWDDNLEEFKIINIFYGRNYSGKTTLSRIARSFELKKHNEDFLEGNFKIKLEDGSFLTQNDVTNSNLDIRVYNSDFAKENLNYLYDKKGNIKGFKSIGAEQKNIKEEIEIIEKNLEEKSKELENIQSNQNNLSKIRKEKMDALDSNLTDKAKFIKSSPNLIKQGNNYNKRNLYVDLDKIKNNEDTYILNDETQNQLIKILEDKEKQNINFKNTFKKDNFQGIFTYSLEILEKEIIIKENLTSELRKWLEEGLKFHKEHSSTQQCKFCNNPLTLERIAWIENNTKDDSGEKEQIKKELKDLLDSFESHKLESK